MYSKHMMLAVFRVINKNISSYSFFLTRDSFLKEFGRGNLVERGRRYREDGRREGSHAE